MKMEQPDVLITRWSPADARLARLAIAACRRVSPSNPLAVANEIEEAFNIVRHIIWAAPWESNEALMQLLKEARALLARMEERQ